MFILISELVASLVAQLVKNPPTMWETWVRSLGWEDPPWKRAYSCLENPVDRGAWWAMNRHKSHLLGVLLGPGSDSPAVLPPCSGCRLVTMAI